MKLPFFLICLSGIASAQFYNITTIAGNGLAHFNGGGQAVNTVLIEPTATAVDASGNIYVSDTYFHQVFQVAPSGVITVYAGNGTAGFSGDGGLATSAQLFAPRGLATDSSGNLFIADTINSRVRKVSPSGVITTVAAQPNVSWVAVDGTGNLYITGGQVVFKVDANGNSTTIAGTGAAGFSGDGGPATSAMLFGPQGLRVDGAGNIYVADQENNRIRKITPQGIISTFAGTTGGGYTGDGGQANAAKLFLPEDIALDGKGNVFISDSLNGRVRMVNVQGVISTVAGGGVSLQNGPPSQAALAPSGITVESSGNIVMAEFNYRRVRRITPLQSVTTIAGILPTAAAGDNVLATSTPLLDPFGVAVDAKANVFIADRIDNRIRKVSPSGIITTVTGDGIPGFSGDGRQASKAEIGQPADLGFDPAGNLFFAAGVVRKITDGSISTVAGSSTPGFSGDGGLATSASFLGPTDAVGDSAGNIYITDRGNNRVRRVDAAGIVTTFAGDGTASFKGDNGTATQAGMFQPFQLALDASNNLFIADWGNSRVRKVTPGGVITTVAGGGPLNGPPNDGGPATSATIGGNLYGVAVDTAGNLYITSNSRIRKVDAATGIISTIAGTGTAGFSGDGGLALNAAISGAQSIAVDAAGNVYFSDESNLRVRKLTPVQIVKEGVFNGATFVAAGVAPGELVTIFGGPGITLGPAAGLGPQVDASGKIATLVSGTQVMFDGVAAPQIYTSSGQINAVVPYEVAGQTSTVLQVVVNGKATNTVTLPVVGTSPGIFAIANPDNTVNSPSNPVAHDKYVVLYGTGEGQTNPAGVDAILNTTVFPTPVAKVSVKVGGKPAQLLYAGAAPDDVAGVFQVDVQIPDGVSGTVPIELTVGGASTPAGPMITVK